jgi:chemotaxis protein CheD
VNAPATALKARPAGADANDQVRMPARRFFDSASSAWLVKVYPGEFFVTSNTDDVLVTVLGSCVAACIRDPKTGFGGMNHFMLAEGDGGAWGEEIMSARYGNFAMERLINELIKNGCPRERMEIKVFGGGNVIESRQAIGTKNAEFVLRYLTNEGLRVAAQDLGGDFPRRIEFSPASGRVVRRILGRTDSAPIVRDETAYANSLATPRKASEDIELFGGVK